VVRKFFPDASPNLRDEKIRAREVIPQQRAKIALRSLPQPTKRKDLGSLSFCEPLWQSECTGTV